MTDRLAAVGGPPWTGGPATPHATCLLAPNPSVLTLDGTNTWLVGDPAAGELLIIDPGPLGDGHGAAIAAQLQRWQARAAGILLTHGHLDHSAGAAALAGRLRCGVRALDPAHRLGAEGLQDGQAIGLRGGAELRVVATPGHSGDSLSFLLEPDGALLTGDTVLGRGTSVVAHPDGRLGDYLASLARLRAIAEQTGARHVLPGHGPVQPDPVGLLDAYLEHRAARLAQVRAALDAGAQTVADVVAVVYADVPQAVWPAASLSVAAQVAYLRELG
jgi:glyoxylase-like metal-dependent hydrolase (beta-lactamase superfamily II)